MTDQLGTASSGREDEEIRMILHEAEYATRTADPVHLIGVANRRRRRNLAATAASSLTVAALAVGGVTQLAGQGGAGENQLPAAQTPARSNATPPAAIGTIPANRRVRIGTGTWFETQGTRWRIARQAEDGTIDPGGWRGTVGNPNIGDGRSPGIAAHSSGSPAVGVVTSVFRVDGVARVRYRFGGRWLDAQVYQLAGIPGWVLSVAEYRPTSDWAMPDAVHAYDATGRTIASLDPPGR